MTTISNTKEALAAAKTRMEKAVEDFRKELGTLRTGRANASLLDSIPFSPFQCTLPSINLRGLRAVSQSKSPLKLWSRLAATELE